MRKTALITGSSSGFGRLIAKKFHAEGWNVIAAMRSPEKGVEFEDLENVLVCRLEVTDRESIREAVAAGLERFGAIDVLVNNAGCGVRGLFEQCRDETVRKIFAVNVLGLMDVTQAVLPHMRARRRGAIINITSVGGMVASPLVSLYTSTKFAVEGFSESLALEVRPFNIFVKTVAPGSFHTNLAGNTTFETERGDDELVTYAKTLSEQTTRLRQRIRKECGWNPDSQEVADKVFECATKDTPIRNVVGVDADLILSMQDSMTHQEFFEAFCKALRS